MPGWSRPLVSTGTKLRPPTNRAVRTAMTNVIAEQLAQVLRAPWNVLASRWVKWDEAFPLVTFQDDAALRKPATHVTCSFNAAIEWPAELAAHWIDFVMAWRRDHVEDALRKLGVTLEAKAWPSLREVCKTLKYFAYENNIGYTDGELVRWVLAAEYVPLREPTPVAEIASTILKTAKYCVCPACFPIATRVWPPLDVQPGIYTEALHAALVVFRVCAPRAGEVILATSHGKGFVSWSGRIVDGALHQVPALTHKTREPRWIHEVDDAIVAILGSTGAAPWHWTESRDGGATWSEPAPSGLPAMRGATTYIQVYRPAIVFATPSTKRQLYLSTDGGRSFGPALDPVFDDKPPYSIDDVNPFGTIYVALWRRTEGGPQELATSADGVEFTTLRSPVDTITAIWPTTAGGLAVFGRYMDETIVAVSNDEGRTWARSPAPSDAKDAYLGGRWFVVQRDVKPAILHASDDEGRTWTQVLSGAVEDVYADGADATSCYVTIGGVLHHVVIR